MKQLAVLF